MAESFFKSIKAELVYGNNLLTREQMKTKVFIYIDIWYNKKRHSYLDYKTIEEFNRNNNYKYVT